MADQSSSPEAQRNTDGMKPVEMETGIGSPWRRCTSRTVFAMDSISCSLRLILGRFLRKSRATAASPERDSSISPEQSAAASASVVSRRMPRSTTSATSSSLS